MIFKRRLNEKLLLLITLISLPSYAAVSANVSFASDYIWRGMTQSDGPAIQVDLIMRLTGFLCWNMGLKCKL
ncbi:MAG: hypothetical protein CM15mP108_2480 [Gammaproteobacteria bacterium]|nr:MAG: hypothetical protein CM15mP108_2480 [Gammaproteobacteria bacterium]